MGLAVRATSAIVDTRFDKHANIFRTPAFVEKVDEIWNLVREEAIKQIRLELCNFAISGELVSIAGGQLSGRTPMPARRRAPSRTTARTPAAAAADGLSSCVPLHKLLETLVKNQSIVEPSTTIAIVATEK